ncbi:hypothetical protein DFA_07417 [Cavenderia fasciculata]|uniref:DNA polymerase alpha subunit B n=1 Tax=Cavenderia fasciculata TaxID=261658 RepID=F4PWD0_CACFS|nr:uncharacterized protein DFA_07417 [Cavenderia fasciculata]EGG20294.1 hypothetical protein DFA_07417 [Cavenderia fasciculata]|eukprot:XP_004367277.1 hypothetical protein DFA_07417 [Cavenderia fasciculata]
MDMDIEDEVVRLFSKSGLSEAADLLKGMLITSCDPYVQNIIKTFKLNALVVHDEWELFCVNNRVSSDHATYLDKFKIAVKKNVNELKKRLGNTKTITHQYHNKPTLMFKFLFSHRDQTLQNKIDKQDEQEFDEIFDFSDVPTVEMVPLPNNNNNNNNNSTDNNTDNYIDDEFEMDLTEDNNNNTFNGISSGLSSHDKQQSQRAIRFAQTKVPSFRFDKRQGADEIVQEYVGERLKSKDIAPQQKMIPKIIEMVPPSKDSGNVDNTPYPTKYMSQTLEGRTKALGDSVLKYYDQFQVEFDPVANADPSNEIQRAVGRIWLYKTGLSLTSQFKLLGNNQSSVNTFSIPNPNEPIFSGQVVMVEGKRIPGQHFGCSKIYYPKQLEFLNSNQRSKKDSSCYIIVASGPFSEYENTLYHPFKELCKVIENKRPNIVILNGPFIDESNQNNQFLDKSFEEFFYEDIIQPLESITSTQFIICPSLRDVQHDYVYPQPPFKSRSKNTSSNIHFVTNPSTLLIDNSFTIGLSNTNIIQQLELRLDNGKNDIKTTGTPLICEKIIQQQCYYPLHPAEVPIETQFIDSIKFPSITPDILIFGKVDKPFIANSNEVLCIGSGQLMNHSGKTGTYTELIVAPGDEIIVHRSKVITRII